MGDVRGSISNSSSSSRRPRSSLVEGGESSLSRKRPRSPPQPPLRYHHGRARDDGEEDDEQSRSEDEWYYDYDDDDDDEESSGGSESHAYDYGVVEARRELPLLAELWSSEYSDDDRPIRVVPRARDFVHPRSRSSTSTSTAPALAPREPSPPPAPSPFPDSASVTMNVTVENTSAFDCTICYLPLTPPIFQCPVGHVVCSPCHGKLVAGQAAAAATRCHVCRAALPRGYLRCNAMEKVVDAIRVACPHAAHGCAAMPAYHDRDAHASACAHMPCHCPRRGCRFAGSVRTTLLEHFAAVHGWPCTAGSTRTFGGGGFDVRLRKGFNVVTAAVAAEDDAQGGSGATTAELEQYTVVLNVEQAAPACNAITAFCIHPFKTGTVKLGLSYDRLWRRQDSSGMVSYIQSSQFDVVCTDLSNGVPGPGSCFPLLVPRWSAAPGGGGEDGDDITVTVSYISGT